MRSNHPRLPLVQNAANRGERPTGAPKKAQPVAAKFLQPRREGFAERRKIRGERCNGRRERCNGEGERRNHKGERLNGAVRPSCRSSLALEGAAETPND